MFKSSAKSGIAFDDAKRVHTALREFNDLSANGVFKNILAQIEANDVDLKFKGAQ